MISTSTNPPEVECPKCGYVWHEDDTIPDHGLESACPDCHAKLVCVDVETTWSWSERTEPDRTKARP